jgi:hypothetical protein
LEKINKHFIAAANQALDMLRPITPGANNLDILFHRNDPKDIYGDHGNPAIRSRRQPDMIVTSLESARRAGALKESASDDWNTISLKQATKKPISHFRWYDVVASVEMESSRKEIPSSYVDKLGKTGGNRLPPNIVDTAPKSNKRTTHSESTPSAVEPALKRCKIEGL